jgi:radical SAM protein with 4Fe4S-binding SPASM domain
MGIGPLPCDYTPGKGAGRSETPTTLSANDGFEGIIGDVPANEPPPPAAIFFGLEVTRRCNLACPHCFTSSGGDQHPGPTREALRDIFQQLVGVGVRHLALSGGEPLLRTDLEEVMAEGRELGLHGYSLVTNGLLVDATRARRLKQVGLVAAQVSLDGVDARDHCAIRNCLPVAYYRALRAIRLLREAKITVDVATLLGGANPGRAPEMVRLCEALGVRKLRYCSFVPTGRASAESVQRRYAVSAAQLDAFLEFFRSYRARQKPAVQLVIDHGIGPWRADGCFQCVAGRQVAYITGEGDLYPCPSLMYAPFKVGNVHQTGLQTLLESPELQRVSCVGRQQLEGACGSCSVSECTGGCWGAAFAATGELLAAPAYCNFQRRIASEQPSDGQP